VLGRPAECHPAVFYELLIDVGKLRRNLDLAVLDTDSLLVANTVRRAHNVVRKSTCLVENRVYIVDFD
jgi:hypothetical protein